jgi:hypothetical protein
MLLKVGRATELRLTKERCLKAALNLYFDLHLVAAGKRGDSLYVPKTSWIHFRIKATVAFTVYYSSSSVRAFSGSA